MIDLDSYWSEAVAELTSRPPNAEVDPSPIRSTEFSDGFGVKFTSLGDYRLFAYYSVPHGAGPHPAIYHAPGYASVVGVPPYDELVLVTRAKFIEQHPDVLRRFVQALGRGYESVRSNPDAAVANLVRLNSGLNRKLQVASVKATLPAFFPRQAGKPWGWQDPAQWNAYGRWMLAHHLISNPNAVVDASTNELLAGQGI